MDDFPPLPPPPVAPKHAFLFRWEESDDYGKGRTPWAEKEIVIPTLTRSAGEAESRFKDDHQHRIAGGYRWSVLSVKYLGEMLGVYFEQR